MTIVSLVANKRLSARTRSKYAWFSSIGLHVLLLAALLLSMVWIHPKPEVNAQQTPTIQSYLAQAPTLNTPDPLPVKTPAKPLAQTSPPMPLEPAVATEEVVVTQAAATSATAPAVDSTSAARQAQTVDALLQLLHNAIQAKQRYPASALAMERQGRVTVTFLLAPNGAISALRLVTSSGTGSLDQAALTAVEQAAPFAGIGAYLTQAKTFQIDVVFELPA